MPFHLTTTFLEEEAIEQIKDREYYRKYTLEDRPLTLVGVSFNKDTGEIAAWKAVENDSNFGL